MVEVIEVVAILLAVILVFKNTLGLHKKLEFGIFQSLLLAVLYLVPTFVSIVRFLLGVLETLLYRLAFILGGTDQAEILERIAASEEG